MRILLVEDDEIMVRMYQRLFRYEGFDVEVAHDGEEGLAKARNFVPDLILLDVMMPKLNGLELLARLKRDSQTKQIIVTLLTNLGVQEEIDKALKAGAVKCITKSNHHPREVVEMVKKILVDRMETGDI